MLCICLSSFGCARAVETTKVIWGSSTKALEEARADALSQKYLCFYTECFDAVLSVSKEAQYEIFIRDRIKGHIVVMGIPGSINTTEVGIFFDALDEKKVKIDISSLSTKAKTEVAKVIFLDLDKKFQKEVSHGSHEN